MLNSRYTHDFFFEIKDKINHSILKENDEKVKIDQDWPIWQQCKNLQKIIFGNHDSMNEDQLNRIRNF